MAEVSKYPCFKFCVSSGPENWEEIARLIKNEWRLNKTSDGFYVAILLDNSKMFFASNSLYEILLTLEKYMGHRWMVINGLMR